MAHTNYFSVLPTEIIETILSQLPMYDMVHLVVAYPFLQTSIQASHFWRKCRIHWMDLIALENAIQARILPKGLRKNIYENVPYLDFSQLDESHIELLESILKFKRLAYLSLSEVMFDQTIFTRLLDSPSISFWEYLDISGCPGMNDICLKRLLQFSSICRLRSLNLSRCLNITDRGLKILFRSERTHTLETINLSSMWRIKEWASILSLIHAYPNLQFIDLSKNDGVTSYVIPSLIPPKRRRSTIDLSECVDLTREDIMRLKPFYMRVIESCLMDDYSIGSVASYVRLLSGIP